MPSVVKLFICIIFLLTSIANSVALEPLSTEMPLSIEAPLSIKLKGSKQEQKALLGQYLFHSSELSAKEGKSCATCHIIKDGGDDNIALASGMNGEKRTTNSPSILHAYNNFNIGWTGEHASIEKLIDAVIRSPKANGGDKDTIIKKLSLNTEVKEHFKQLYADGVQYSNIIDALVHYLKSISKPNSRYDDYLNGKHQALNAVEIEGLHLFNSYGCKTCHQGKNIGGNSFQKLGVFENYFEQEKNTINDTDLGRYNITQNKRDTYYFRVPSLRNVALTAPYFHDGSVETLDDVIVVMGKYQLSRNIPKQDREKIIQFLRTLTDKELTGND